MCVCVLGASPEIVEKIFDSTRGLWPRDIMSTKLDSLVLLVTISALLWPTGHGQLWVKENDSSAFDIGYNQEPLLTRRIRQFSGPSTTIITDNNNGQPNQNHPPLTCHQCRSFEDGDQCIHLAVNSSIFNEPCGSQHTACMVKITNF